MSRSHKISKVSNQYEAEDAWLKRFKDNIQKAPVKNNNLYQQILSVMNGSNKYSSVEDAVKDMQERSGLAAFLSKKADDNSSYSEEVKSAITDVVNKYPGLNYAAALDKLSSHFSNNQPALEALKDPNVKQFLIDSLKKSIREESPGKISPAVEDGGDSLSNDTLSIFK